MSEKLFYPIGPSGKEEAKNAGPTQLEINNGAASVSVSPEIGGMVTQFSVSGKDILYFDLDTFRSEKKPKVGVPVLLPFGGSDREKIVRQHGGLREVPWVWETRDKHSITLSLDTANIKDEKLLSELREKFGANLNFTYEVKISVGETSLAYDIKIKNNGSTDMPVTPGLHPYFKVDPEKQDEMKSNLQGFDLSERTWAPDEYALITSRPPGEDVWFTIPGTGKVIVKCAEEFDTFVVWSKQKENGEKEDYLCVEPWVGKPSTIDNKEKRITVAPGKEITLSVIFDIEPETG